jgi:hypothetical protein
MNGDETTTVGRVTVEFSVANYYDVIRRSRAPWPPERSAR